MADETSAQSVRWFGQTDVGRFRKDNQDTFLLLAVDGEGVRRLGKYGEADLKAARDLFEKLIFEEEFTEFLTLPAYGHLVAAGPS